MVQKQSRQTGQQDDDPARPSARPPRGSLAPFTRVANISFALMRERITFGSKTALEGAQPVPGNHLMAETLVGWEWLRGRPAIFDS
jgi:hypothetical protein